MKHFEERIRDWQKMIIDKMVATAKDDRSKTALKGALGQKIAFFRMSKALGTNTYQLERKLVRSHLRRLSGRNRVLKPKVIR